MERNNRRNKELSPYTRGQIVSARNHGDTYARIQHDFQLPYSTVYDTVNNALNRPHGESHKRSGCPQKLTDRDNRSIIRYIRKNPFATYATVKRELHLAVSTKTIQRALQASTIGKWMAKSRPLLTAETARLRFRWAKNHKNWSTFQWSKVIFSDECSVERGAGHKRLWVFRKPNEGYQPNKVQTRNKSKDIRIMVWGAIYDNQKSDLMVMRRDITSKKQGYTAESYLNVISYAIPQIWKPDMLYQQDGASIHMANKTKAWLKEMDINLIDSWPPYSPDLNPIEHLWSILKERLYQLFPDTETWSGSEASIIERMEDSLVYAWSTIEPEIIHNCCRSIEERIQAVIDSKGWYTRF